MPRTFPGLFAVLVFLGTLGLLSVPAATALTLDFEEFANHGDVVTSSQGVAVTAENGSIDLAVVFDTENGPGTEDRDLYRNAGWAFGNLAPDSVLDNILILQENTAGCGDDTCDRPDDEGSRPAGEFTFLLDDTFQFFSFDLVDVENTNDELGSIVFQLGDAEVATFGFDEFPALVGAVFGNNSANRIDLGLIGDFDTVVIEMGGSGGIDNLVALGQVVVPEPATATMLGLGLLTLGVVGRRRG